MLQTKKKNVHPSKLQDHDLRSISYVLSTCICAVTVIVFGSTTKSNYLDVVQTSDLHFPAGWQRILARNMCSAGHYAMHGHGHSHLFRLGPPETTKAPRDACV